MQRSFSQEIARRRTFAIISHPDAGKTTLTEKLLLYGGALHLAGSVRARKNQRSATSDWMELEKERGISITSTVLQFEYRGHCINLLDTPGHKDFSEDTYRVLTAVDSVIMVIDAAKGIEERTRKLFEICRMRGIPIFTFMNKMDRPTQDPLALVDELEKVLNLEAFPVTWPMGSGADFLGVYDRIAGQIHTFERTIGGQHKAPVRVGGVDDPSLAAMMIPEEYLQWKQEVEMLAVAGTAFDRERIMSGTVTPVFFGSAMTNFGIQLLLDYFIEYGAPPASRKSSAGVIEPHHEEFSGFVFKVQANMNPKHRDTIAFVRVCSGKFTKDMQVSDPETGRPIRLSYPQKMFGQERETVEEAYPGDIVGLVAHRSFRIGDTLSTKPGIRYQEIPRFPPEVFGYLRNPTPSKFKQFKAGLSQLLNEGVIQVFHLPETVSTAPLLGAVGSLQFDVVLYRLESEYNAPARLEPATYQVIRWLDPAITQAEVDRMYFGTGVQIARDVQNCFVVLFPNKWTIDYFIEKNPKIALHLVSPSQAPMHETADIDG
jgi:peptide chain release factor 3